MNYSLMKRNISNTPGSMFTLNGNEIYDKEERNVPMKQNCNIIILKCCLKKIQQSV